MISLQTITRVRRNGSGKQKLTSMTPSRIAMTQESLNPRGLRFDLFFPRHKALHWTGQLGEIRIKKGGNLMKGTEHV